MIKQILNCLTMELPWSDHFIWYDETDSTNTRAKALAAAGAPHGTVLIADRQTGGRGRSGRRFLSPSSMGVYMSVILRPDCPPDQLMHLTCAAAVAMCDAVEQAAGFRPGIKWTNDLVARKKKLAGILTELSLDPATGKVAYAVIGIGINCCQTSDDFAEEIRPIAGSLSMIAGREISRPQLAAAMVEALYRMDASLLTQKETIMHRYQQDCITVGCEVCVLRGDSVRRGKAVGIDPDGALLVEFTPGQTETVNSGEVSVRGLYGYV